MRQSTTAYRLINENESVRFESESDACKYLGVAKCSVASCFRRNAFCKGYKIERIGRTTHGGTHTRLFKIWQSMRERCYRKQHKHYKNYGGRGIVVCDGWLGDDGFSRFKDWAIANGYDDGLTLDRVDTNGNYTPSNCRWATVKEQMNNKRNNHWVYVNGEKMTVTQCAERHGIPKSTVRWRAAHGKNVVNGVQMNLSDFSTGCDGANMGDEVSTEEREDDD